MRFLNSVIVRAIHTDLIQRYGGSYGLRDAGLLESALARPQQLKHYDRTAGLGEMAASLGWGLVKNHAFVDGNKRIAIAAVITFLKLNGYRLACSEIEETAMVLRAAGSELSEQDWTAWMVRTIAALPH